ncbi:MAG: helix-turn-helix domain-containing protein [Candidatus Hodarchaeota archaeon]
MSLKEDEFKSTKQVLELIGLSQEEVNTYFHLTGRGPVLTGEIALLINVSEEKAAQIAKNLLNKGLVREVPGKTPFYVALPPYTALLNQIGQFKNVVKGIRETTPKTLELKFHEIEEQSAKLGKLNEYRNYIHMMKENLPAQLKIQFSRIEKELESVKKFQEIRSFILNLREIVPDEIIKEFGLVEDRLEKMKAEISDAFEKQFRIGALKSMAEKIVSRIISEQFIDLTDYFKEKFVKAIENTLDQVTNQLATISDAAGEMTTDLGDTFTDIEGRLRDTLEDLDKRISSVYEDVDKGIEELKQMFQKEIYNTLEEDIMLSIIKQLDLSEDTMTEFFERSKRASMLSYRDVWFVRSIEGMKAQINETLTRVKMRVHIIAPSLDDIDIVAISNVKKHINVRISTNFDWNNNNHKNILAQILKYPNISIRHYPRENIYAINRDFEELVVCAVSKTELEDFEIAGMGSIIEEHVKLFAGVLEEVWMQAKKVSDEEIKYALGADFQLPAQKEVKPVIPKTTPKPVTQLKPEPSYIPKKVEPLKQKPQVEKKPQMKSKPAIEVPKSGPIDLAGKSILELFTEVINNLDKKVGTEISSDIELIRNKLVEEKGYSSVLGQMSITIASLKITPKLLTKFEIEETKKKIQFWMKKLNIK